MIRGCIKESTVIPSWKAKQTWRKLEQSPPRNPFIDDEATEVSDADSQLEGEEEDESDPNDCVIVETLTEDEVNAIDDLEYLTDFDNWLCDDEFVNRIKRAKRRGMEVVIDSESE